MYPGTRVRQYMGTAIGNTETLLAVRGAWYGGGGEGNRRHGCPHSGTTYLSQSSVISQQLWNMSE